MTKPWLASRRCFGVSSVPWAKRYSEEHEWVEVSDGGKEATIGITDYAQKALGDVVFVELPEVAAQIEKGDTVGAVESVKAASDIYSPVTGTIAEVNEALSDKPSLLNKSPEKEGWIFKVEIESEAELDSLMDTEKYAAFVKGQEDKENE